MVSTAEKADEQPRGEARIHADERFSDELDEVAEALENALAAGDLGGFYRSFRGTGLPFLPVELRKAPDALFSRTAEVVRHLAYRSPAVALAVENHYYVLSAIATLPVAPGERLHDRRLELLEEVRANRWLVANTNSRVHGDQVAKTGTVAKRRGTGYVVSGKAVYMSLASEGDLIVFVTFFESGEPAIFACPKKTHPGIEVGPLLFPDVMQDSDTRRVSFHDAELDEGRLLVSGLERPDILSIITFQLIWHQALLAALSLGAAERAIHEGRLFLRSAKRPDGVPLAELDGMVVDMGRQALRSRLARSSVDQAGRSLARVAAEPLEPRSLDDAFEHACAAKHFTTGFAEEVVGMARRVVGARSFTGGHALERLTKEVVFGQLGGEVNAFIERRAGERVLGQQSFLSPAPRRPRSKSLASLRARAQARKAGLRKDRDEVERG